jgi:dTDP-4-amino-4,6-dideoxygalactose transaminase
MAAPPGPFEIREVPFGPMGGVYERDDADAAARVIDAALGNASAGFFPLPEETQFQAALATHEGARHAVAVNSCGTALDLCMMALGVGPGDEVITTPLTFVCTAGCAVARGARVVFADVDLGTLCLDPANVRGRITPRTKAIIPVHFAGHPCDVDAFDAITADTGVPVIYDAAHSVGARLNARAVGGRGKASCYSFQSNKNMTTLGEGGAVTTDDPDFAEAVRQRKTFGYVYGPSLRVASIGFNYRMTKPQLAVGLTQLAKIDRVIARRLEVFRTMHALLEGVEGIIRPAGIDAGHGCHLYVARIDSGRTHVSRSDFLQVMKQRYRVACGNHYPAVWSWDAFAELGYDERSASCPIAARACREVFSLPLFPHTTEDDCRYIAWAVRQSLVESGKR